MSKTDLFVVIWCSIWASIIVILGIYFYFKPDFNVIYFVIVSNASFLSVTAATRWIKPVWNWINKHIIDKLP